MLHRDEIKGERVIISGEKAKYLISVLRCNVGDELQIFDGEDSLYQARISEINKKNVAVDLLGKVLCDTESQLNLVLIQGILKGEKMDLVIQKTTELGVKEIIPVITERGQVRQTKKLLRWRKIAEEASRQSARSSIPMIHEPLEFQSLSEYLRKEPQGLHLNGFIFWEEGGLPLRKAIESFSNNPASLYLLIGPEGGFTLEEVRRAEESGLIRTTLGRRILRAETAAISAVTLVQFLLGDI